MVLTANETDSFGPKSVQLGVQDHLLKSHLTAEALCRTSWFAMERQKLTLRLAQLERTQRRLLDRARDPIWTMDAGLRVTYANTAAVRLLWPGSPEYAGESLADLVDAEFETQLSEASRGQHGTDDIEAVVAFVDCDGTERRLAMEIRKRSDGSLEAVASDITAFTAAAPALLRRRLEHLLGDAKAGPGPLYGVA